MSLYKREGSEIWWADIRHAGQRVRRSTGHTDRAAATAEHNKLQIELWQLVPVTDEHTWGQAVIAWVEVKPRGEPDLLRLRKFSGLFPDRGLSEVTRTAVDEALSFCSTAGTYRRYRAIIVAVLNLAADNEWITTVPRLKTKEGKKKPREWITQAQFERLYTELPPHMKPMARFAVETGLRQANVLGLLWSQVSLPRKTVTLEANVMKAEQALAVPLSNGAASLLWEMRSDSPHSSAYVFLYRGNPIKEIKTAFQAACVRADLGRYVDGKYQGFTWHGMRHTWATWHIQSGTPIDVLQKLGGWADLRMVTNYAQHSPGYLAQFANNVKKTEDDE